MLFRLAAYSRDADGVFDLLSEKESRLPVIGQTNTIGSWLLLIGALEALAIIGARKQAAEFYPLVRELIASGAVFVAHSCRFPENDSRSCRRISGRLGR